MMKKTQRNTIILSSIMLFAFILAGCVSSPYSGYGYSSGSAAPSVKQPTKVALLVPLKTTSGQAVRNGFLASYYNAKQQANAPTVDVLDTSNGDVVALYQQAVSQGADFVVGPLSKQNVQTLAAHRNLPVPVLALNSVGNAQSVPNLYQFSLAPEEEAAQVADRAARAGHANALIVASDDAWGQRLSEAFRQSFEAQGGTVTENFAYGTWNLPEQIKTAVRAGEVVKDGPERRSLPESRQDIDMIFLVAFPQKARQIKPLFTYYNTGNTPVYATSLVYSGVSAPAYDKDLDGIEFDDMPWLVGPQQAEWVKVREHAKTLWPASYNRSPRLYAMGVDAYHLTDRLHILTQGSTYQGATGLLSVDSSQNIRRQLEWARMQNGQPQRIN